MKEKRKRFLGGRGRKRRIIETAGNDPRVEKKKGTQVYVKKGYPKKGDPAPPQRRGGAPSEKKKR